MVRKMLIVLGCGVMALTIPVQGIDADPGAGRLHTNTTELHPSLMEQKLHGLYDNLKLQAQGLEFEVFEKAMIGYLNLKKNDQLSSKPLLTIVDFAKSSRQKRLWVINLEEKKVLFNTLVAHGRNTGEEFARAFSNTSESYMSSLGFYVTDQTYMGKHGLSLKLRGMDEEFNSNAMDRAVVMHGADYVSEEFIRAYGRLGRSLGCPAVPEEMNQKIVETIKDNTCLYLHYPTEEYTSKYLDAQTAVATLMQINLQL